MTLPSEVLALLGDDATPEGAAKRHDEFIAAATVRGCPLLPTAAYDAALAAAAIRACEADRALHDLACRNEALVGQPETEAERAEWHRVEEAAHAAAAAYDALRAWRKP